MMHLLYEITYYLVYYAMLYVFPFAFFFFLTITVAMRDLNSKLKFREIMQSVFKKFF